MVVTVVSLMHYKIHTFSVPKMGEAESTNQDRLAHSADGCVSAISDGAGSSLYPGEWANILVDSFCRNPSLMLSNYQHSKQWLSPLQEEWRQFYLDKLRSPSKKWWQGGSRTKSHGSATFLGLVLSDNNGWSAIAVGDSCLFQYSQGDSLLSFPLQASAEFKSTTSCFSSLPEYPSAIPVIKEGSYAVGDCFLLATDALSQCILAGQENQSMDWTQVLDVDSHEAFKDLIVRLRHRKQIKNDDTSLIRVQILPGRP